MRLYLKTKKFNNIDSNDTSSSENRLIISHLKINSIRNKCKAIYRLSLYQFFINIKHNLEIRIARNKESYLFHKKLFLERSILKIYILFE